MLRLRQVAERLNCSVQEVYVLKNAGLLAIVRTGLRKGFRVEEAELQRYIDSRRETRRQDATVFPKKSSPRLFKHLDGDRLRSAWRQRDNRGDQQDGDSAQSSG